MDDRRHQGDDEQRCEGDDGGSNRAPQMAVVARARPREGRDEPPAHQSGPETRRPAFRHEVEPGERHERQVDIERCAETTSAINRAYGGLE